MVHLPRCAHEGPNVLPLAFQTNYAGIRRHPAAGRGFLKSSIEPTLLYPRPFLLKVAPPPPPRPRPSPAAASGAATAVFDVRTIRNCDRPSNRVLRLGGPSLANLHSCLSRARPVRTFLQLSLSHISFQGQSSFIPLPSFLSSSLHLASKLGSPSFARLSLLLPDKAT